MPSDIDALEGYFSHGAGKDIKSFVRFSLFHSGVPFAVINVHSDATGVLGINRLEKFDIFESMTLPLLHELGTILHLFLSLEHDVD